MKRISSIFGFLAAGALILTSCGPDEIVSLGTDISTDVSELTFEGQNATAKTVQVTADGEWIATAPEWIKVTPAFGSGAATVTITVTDNLYVGEDGGSNPLAAERTANVNFCVSDKSAAVKVTQAGDPDKKVPEPSVVTIAEYLADSDEIAATKAYILEGVITSIENDVYGNIWIADATGTVYIYGVLDKEGNRKNFASLGLSVGDKVKLQAAVNSRAYYGTLLEVKNAQYLSHTQSILSIEPKVFDLEKAATQIELVIKSKGTGLDVDFADDCDWVSLAAFNAAADSTIVKLNVAENTGLTPRETEVAFSSYNDKKEKTTISVAISQKGNVPAKVTIAEALSTKAYSHIEATVTAISSKGYVVTDETGSLLVYLNAAPDASVKIGNKMQLVGKISVYNFGGQMGIPDLAVKLSGATYTYPTPKVLDATAIAAYVAALEGKTKNVDIVADAAYVKMTGTLSVSDTYYNIAVDGVTNAQGSIYLPNAELTNQVTALASKKVEILGYLTSISGSSTRYMNVLITSIAEVK
ncbi:MAG: BACON domain-containing carbohydrate-binding protein [Tidjanibacter sp.]|nr:BACON domain-containing carbohydrate-binding protein [Tidjanibacter sp.]